MKPVWDAGGSHLLLLPIIIISNEETIILLPPCNLRPVWITWVSHLFYYHLQSRNYYISCPLAIWSLSGLQGGLTSASTYYYHLQSRDHYITAPWQYEASLGCRESHLTSCFYLLLLFPIYRLQKVSGSIPGLGENFSTFVTSVARKSSGQLARKMIVVRPCINAWQR